MPKIFPESENVYQVYKRMFGPIENPDIFSVMELVGIERENQLFCIDLVNIARIEVLKTREVKT